MRNKRAVRRKRVGKMEHPSNFVDLTGRKFQSWTVESLSHTKGWRLYWNCRCDCGNQKVMRGDSIQKIQVPYCSQCKPRNAVLDIDAIPDGVAAQVRERKSGIFQNTFIVDGPVVYGYTSNAECSLFDTADIEKTKKHTWSRKHMRDGWYVYTVVKQKFTYFHTLILDNLECRKRIDHINRDKLDNRRENLRFCCDQQNAFNQGMPKTNTLGYKGLAKHTSGRWNAVITFCQKKISLGLYDTKVEAAAVYDAAAELLFGEFCRLNRECVAGVPHATPDQRSYVVYRCLKRLEGIQWAQNPELLDAAFRRLHREQEGLAA